jgi:hypothetical protein
MYNSLTLEMRMSDGPHRSLNMNRFWKRVAECADNNAYSLDELARAYLPALEKSCQDEVPDEVWRQLKRLFLNTQHALFGDQIAEEIGALRYEPAGPLGRCLVDAAEKAASAGARGSEVLVEVTTKALLQRAARGNKQVEEHWYRKSNSQRTENVRNRLENALNKAAIGTLARQRLDMNPAPISLRFRKQKDLDDGVLL